MKRLKERFDKYSLFDLMLDMGTVICFLICLYILFMKGM